MKILMILMLFGFVGSLGMANSPMDQKKIKQLTETYNLKKQSLTPQDQMKLMQAVSAIELVPIDPAKGKFGIKIKKVSAIPNMDKMGLKDNDIIVGIDGVGLDHSAASMKLFEKIKKQKDFLIKVRRGKTVQEIKVSYK